jgi:hypothetical protein
LLTRKELCIETKGREMMPTHETWLNENIIATQWAHRLTAYELNTCFRNLRRMLDTAAYPVHILFDIREAGAIPPQAPVLAIRSRFLTAEPLGKVAVVSTDIIAQILARTASRVTRRDITFFPHYDVAINYLQADRSAIG